MENASKALLIAGAILICILLIGIGMLVYQSTQGTISEAVAQMSSQEKDIFNSQFQQYSGQRVNGSNVRALLQKVRSNNTANQDVEEKQVAITGNGIPKTTEITAEIINNIITAKTYKVEPEDENGDGLIDIITINAVQNT